MSLNPRIRSPKEEPLFILGLIFSLACWLVLVVTVVGLIYGAMILFFVLVAHALFLAHVHGDGLRISERQLPDLYQRIKDAARKLGLADVPEVYILQSNGLLNAFATKLLSRRVVIIYSNLVDQCSDPQQLDFVIGHELGHLAAGHLTWNFFLLPFRLMPWLGPAYSRACEYTCDRAGFAVVGQLEPSMRALCVLAAGGQLAGKVDLEDFIDQCRDSGRFWMSVFELSSTHPYLCKRAAALQEYAAPGTVRPVRRNALAYPLAPFLAISTGGPQGVFLVVLVIVVMMAAFTIPIFVRYKQQWEQAASQVVPAPSALMPDSNSEDEEESGDEDSNKALEEAERMAKEANSSSGQTEPDQGTGRRRAPPQ